MDIILVLGRYREENLAFKAKLLKPLHYNWGSNLKTHSAFKEPQKFIRKQGVIFDKKFKKCVISGGCGSMFKHSALICCTLKDNNTDLHIDSTLLLLLKARCPQSSNHQYLFNLDVGLDRQIFLIAFVQLT